MKLNPFNYDSNVIDKSHCLTERQSNYSILIQILCLLFVLIVFFELKF
jgi:hypothetical protein